MKRMEIIDPVFSLAPSLFYNELGDTISKWQQEYGGNH